MVTYGRSRDSDVRALDVKETSGGVSFTVGKTVFDLPVPGRHNLQNALAAITVGLRLSVPIEEIAARLAGVALPAMRLERRTVAGIELLVDCYNANPKSVKAALRVLCGDCRGRRIFVFGGMGELGERSAELHRGVGRRAAQCGAEVVVTIGEDAALAGRAARGVAGSRCEVCLCADCQEAAAVLEQVMAAGDRVLFKASRAARLETLVDKVTGRLARCEV